MVRQLSALRVEPNATPYGSEQARWIRQNLPELESIKVGMTRGELLKVFMEEGGISFPSPRPVRLNAVAVKWLYFH